MVVILLNNRIDKVIVFTRFEDFWRLRLCLHFALFSLFFAAQIQVILFREFLETFFKLARGLVFLRNEAVKWYFRRVILQVDLVEIWRPHLSTSASVQLLYRHPPVVERLTRRPP